MIQSLIFDLDDTLYPEIDFLTGGYRAVARYVSGKYGGDCDEIFCSMMVAYASFGRNSVFPRMIREFLGGAVEVSELVQVYRGHLPQIRLYPGYECLLERLSREYRLGIITDGLPEVQRRKVHALGLEYRMDKVICTWDYGREMEKPNPFAFSLMMDYLRIDPGEAMYVGDNSDKDRRGAHAAGLHFAQIRTGRSASEPEARDEGPNIVIDSLYQLPQILEQTDQCHIMRS